MSDKKLQDLETLLNQQLESLKQSIGDLPNAIQKTSLTIGNLCLIDGGITRFNKVYSLLPKSLKADYARFIKDFSKGSLALTNGKVKKTKKELGFNFLASFKATIKIAKKKKENKPFDLSTYKALVLKRLEAQGLTLESLVNAPLPAPKDKAKTKN